jgi:hypothetical protein
MFKHANPRIQKYLQLLVIVCAFGVLVLIAIEFSFELEPNHKRIVELVNIVILMIFLIELLYNLYYAQKKGDYLRKHWLDVIAVLPIIEVFQMAEIANLAQVSVLLGFGEGVEVVEVAELAKLEKTTKAGQILKVAEGSKLGLFERVYEGFRVFWHEKLAFQHRDVISLPLSYKLKRGYSIGRKRK